MKSVVAKVKNVSAFFVAGQALIGRSVNTPGICVAFGPAGFGKSKTVSHWAVHTNASYVRAMATWRTPGPMLGAICSELGLSPRSRHDDSIKMIAEVLARPAVPRPLAVDEADYLVKHEVLLNALRDINDLSGAPLVVIGMQHFLARLMSLRDQEQFVSRISQVVEFKALDREDAGLLLAAIGDVTVEPDLVDRLFKETGGNARLLVVAMAQIESHARNLGLKSIGTAQTAKLKLTLDRRPEILDRLGLRSALQVTA